LFPSIRWCAVVEHTQRVFLSRQELFYSDREFDRAAERRMDSKWLSTALQEPGTKVLPVWDRKSLVKDGRAVILQYTSLLEQVQREGWTAVPILLGVLRGDQEAVFALDVTDQQAGRYAYL
jgi:hypothetical protein